MYLVSSNKGLAISTTAMIILFLVSFVVTGVTISQLTKDTDDLVDRELCKHTITEGEGTKIADFECPARRVHIEKQEEYNDEHVKDEIAKSMISCWKLVGSGEHNPFRRKTPVRTTPKSKICLICDIISFDEMGTIDHLYLWMARNRPFVAGEEKSYFEVLMGRPIEEEEVELFQNSNYRINTSKEYAVAWRISSKTRAPTTYGTQTEKNSQDIIIVPYSDLLDGYCEDVLN